jgi:hypothetical protein
MVLIMQNITHSKTLNKRKTIQKYESEMNIRHKLSVNKKQIQTNRAKAIIIFIFT